MSTFVAPDRDLAVATSDIIKQFLHYNLPEKMGSCGL